LFATHRQQAGSYKDKTVFLCRSQPAGDGGRPRCAASCEESLAGKLLQGEKRRVFV